MTRTPQAPGPASILSRIDDEDARELVDDGTALESACRIIILEDQLADALRINAELKKAQPQPRPSPPNRSPR